FFNDPATTEIYTLSLHDALPIFFMGMGEPLANLKNVIRAIRIINASWGLRIGARHITVSTSGLAPQIKKLADEPLQIRLAVSLRSEEHTSELQSRFDLVCRLLLE